MTSPIALRKSYGHVNHTDERKPENFYNSKDKAKPLIILTNVYLPIFPRFSGYTFLLRAPIALFDQTFDFKLRQVDMIFSLYPFGSINIPKCWNKSLIIVQGPVVQSPIKLILG